MKMESKTGKVLAWSGKVEPSRSGTPLDTGAPSVPSFAPIDDLVILIGDEQLEALGALFCMNPVRRAMTFEAYLAVRGFGVMYGSSKGPKRIGEKRILERSTSAFR
jgi:hypothetical protein